MRCQTKLLGGGIFTAVEWYTTKFTYWLYQIYLFMFLWWWCAWLTRADSSAIYSTLICFPASKNGGAHLLSQNLKVGPPPPFNTSLILMWWCELWTWTTSSCISMEKNWVLPWPCCFLCLVLDFLFLWVMAIFDH